MAQTRNIDPEVASRKGRHAGLVARGAPEHVIRQARADLDYANRVAAIKSAVRNAPPLDPAVRDAIVGMLYAAGGAE